MTEPDGDRLIQQFIQSVRRSDLEGWLDEWRSKVEMRTFESNVVDVTCNFREGWADLRDVLSSGTTVRFASVDDMLELLR